MVPGITDREEYLYRLGRYLGTLKNCKKRWMILPYHDMGKAKYRQLGIPYPLEDTAPCLPQRRQRPLKNYSSGNARRKDPLLLNLYNIRWFRNDFPLE